jgi:hypothetical protein
VTGPSRTQLIGMMIALAAITALALFRSCRMAPF